jgi:hypothetical protein
MMDSAKRLAQTRLAILEHLHNKEKPARGSAQSTARATARRAVGLPENEQEAREQHAEESQVAAASARAGRFTGLRYAFGTWWRHHPAHMAVELATPTLSRYAGRKPLQFLGIAAAVGAVLVLARPWKLMSATGLLVAVLKSSQLSSLVMSAISAADYQNDGEPRRR